MTTFGVILTILLFAAAIILPWILIFSNRGYYTPIAESIFMSLGANVIFTFIAFLIVACLMGISYNSDTAVPVESSKVYHEVYSIALRDNNEQQGVFVLGIGEINGETKPVYRFYVKTEQGAYRFMTVDAEKYDIVCTDTVAPHIEWYEKETQQPTCLRWIFNEPQDFYISKKDKTGLIYIPENSIVQSYKIEL